ncbi:MAG: thiopurine S-methyltransferase [Betaproteobacteria bacterium HGW-Betaproteobacteria-11]|nr:MAG: thiopurine S-methyltransferase [Betaproteobacteria bacterium HGW-Betaproteobacteria-11]
MDADFWHQRWAKNEIGFHRSEHHPSLIRFWPTLGVPEGAPVFVPLCGKSRDLLWLRAAGHEVIGVELSPLAVESFFAENGIPARVGRDGAFDVYRGGGFTLYCGDFFALEPALLAGVHGVYDRAALVALPPALRRDYAAHLVRLLPPATQTLLVSFEYPQEEMDGPPFSVGEDEIRTLFAPVAAIEHLATSDILAQEERFRKRGLSRLVEKTFRLRHRATM